MLLKRGKREALEIAAQIAPWLTERGHEALIVGGAPVDGARVVDESDLAAQIGLLVVLGGDGTLLHGAWLVADRGVPLLGVNLGHLGFLTSCAPADATLSLERALAGKMALEERLRLRCVLHRADGELLSRNACNDVVVTQGAMARLIDLEALLDGVPITHYRSDGLIVATPTGSTAYNLAAGGPIVTPDVRAFVITPICSHALTNRPVVAPAASRLTIRLASPADHVLLTVDGQWVTQLGPQDRVEISLATPPLYLFRPAQSYFDVLREKMRWGEREV